MVDIQLLKLQKFFRPFSDSELQVFHERLIMEELEYLRV